MRLLVALLLLAGCTAAPAPTPGDRLASLSPALTETIGALGGLDRLVARSAYCDLPAAARAIPPAGSALTPELETLARLRPSRVLIDGSAGARDDELARLAPVERLAWLTVPEIAGSTRRLGQLLDAGDAAEALAARFEVELTAGPPPDGPLALGVLGSSRIADGEIWFVRADSLHGAAMRAAGLREVLPEAPSGPPVLGLEELLRLDPPAIVVLDHGVDDARRSAILAAWSRLGALRAVRDGRIVVVQAPHLFAAGPAIFETIDRIRDGVAPLRPAGERSAPAGASALAPSPADR